LIPVRLAFLLAVFCVLLPAPSRAHADDPALAAAREHVARMPVYSTVTGGYLLPGMSAKVVTWTPVDAAEVVPDLDAPPADDRDAGGPSAVVADPQDDAVVYVTYATPGGPRVWRSGDGGTSWTSIDGSGPTALPDVPVHALAVDPTDGARLYVASDLGVFVSRDTGRTWAAEHTGFGDAITTWLTVRDVDGVPNVFAGLEDGSVWRVPLASVPEADTAVLTVTRAGDGRGTVSSDPAGIRCRRTCSATFAAGTDVELRAVPAADSIFVRWSGACGGTAPTCTVTVSDSTTVTATFRSHRLAITRIGTGHGRVRSAPEGIDCGPTCRDRFRPRTSITLTATPATGSVFAGWSGVAGCGRAPVCTFTITATVSAVAKFTSRMATLTAAKTGTGTGTVTTSPAGISCGGSCTSDTARFLLGTVVRLTATPTAGASHFGGWGGACAGTSPTCTVTMSVARSVTASFIKSAQVRFVNHTQYAGQPFPATLTTAQGYQWISTSGTPSAYRAVSHATLSTLVVHVPGWAYSFAGSLTVTPGRKHRIEFYFASPTATQPSLGIECEDCPAAAARPPRPDVVIPAPDPTRPVPLEPVPAAR
jgi:hypothetical protein